MFPLRDTIPSRHPPVMVVSLIVVNAGVFLFELAMPSDVQVPFFYYFGLVPAPYTHLLWAEYLGFPVDNYWPFFTSMFLHAGLLHIASNMWAL